MFPAVERYCLAVCFVCFTEKNLSALTSIKPTSHFETAWHYGYRSYIDNIKRNMGAHMYTRIHMYIWTISDLQIWVYLPYSSSRVLANRLHWCCCNCCCLFVCLFIRLFIFWQTAPGQTKRLFRKVKNLISAFEKPDQGIAVPLLYPVTAQKFW